MREKRLKILSLKVEQKKLLLKVNLHFKNLRQKIWNKNQKEGILKSSKHLILFKQKLKRVTCLAKMCLFQKSECQDREITSLFKIKKIIWGVKALTEKGRCNNKRTKQMSKVSLSRIPNFRWLLSETISLLGKSYKLND